MPLFDQDGCTVEAMSGGHYVRVERDGKLLGKLLIPSWIPVDAMASILKDRGCVLRPITVGEAESILASGIVSRAGGSDDYQYGADFSNDDAGKVAMVPATAEEFANSPEGIAYFNGRKASKKVLLYNGTAEDAAKVANAEDDKIEVVTVRDASSMSPAVPANGASPDWVGYVRMFEEVRYFPDESDKSKLVAVTSDGKTFIENGDGKMVPRTPPDPIQDPT